MPMVGPLRPRGEGRAYVSSGRCASTGRLSAVHKLMAVRSARSCVVRRCYAFRAQGHGVHRI